MAAAFAGRLGWFCSPAVNWQRRRKRPSSSCRPVPGPCAARARRERRRHRRTRSPAPHTNGASTAASIESRSAQRSGRMIAAVRLYVGAGNARDAAPAPPRLRFASGLRSRSRGPNGGHASMVTGDHRAQGPGRVVRPTTDDDGAAGAVEEPTACLRRGDPPRPFLCFTGFRHVDFASRAKPHRAPRAAVNIGRRPFSPQPANQRSQDSKRPAA